MGDVLEATPKRSSAGSTVLLHVFIQSSAKPR